MLQVARYRSFRDGGHGWLEVPRAEVEASGAQISPYSYYDPKTDMVYLEEDCDMWSFLHAAHVTLTNANVTTVHSSLPRSLTAYTP